MNPVDSYKSGIVYMGFGAKQIMESVLGQERYKSIVSNLGAKLNTAKEKVQDTLADLVIGMIPRTPALAAATTGQAYPLVVEGSAVLRGVYLFAKDKRKKKQGKGNPPPTKDRAEDRRYGELMKRAHAGERYSPTELKRLRKQRSQKSKRLKR